MRFIILVKASAASEAGTLPDGSLFAAMAAYHEELARAGVLLDAAGLKPRPKPSSRFVLWPGPPSDPAFSLYAMLESDVRLTSDKGADYRSISRRCVSMDGHDIAMGSGRSARLLFVGCPHRRRSGIRAGRCTGMDRQS